MKKEDNITTSIYRKIAIDIAKNISNGKYVEGQKLFGRSILASQYKVSPETIRKAVYILKDLGILDTEKGSGIEVISISKAIQFINNCNVVEDIIQTRNEVLIWTKNQVKETTEIMKKIGFIIDATEKISNTTTLLPFEITITSSSSAIGKTSDELKFWHNTGGTIIAIKRNDILIISPGPYATFQENDTFYIIGNHQSYLAANKLLFE